MAVATNIYNGPIGDPQTSVMTVSAFQTGPIGGDPPVTFRSGSAAFTSGNAVPQFRRVRGLPAFINPAGLAGSDDMTNVGHPVASVPQPSLSPASG